MGGSPFHTLGSKPGVVIDSIETWKMGSILSNFVEPSHMNNAWHVLYFYLEMAKEQTWIAIYFVCMWKSLDRVVELKGMCQKYEEIYSHIFDSWRGVVILSSCRMENGIYHLHILEKNKNSFSPLAKYFFLKFDYVDWTVPLIYIVDPNG